MGETTCRYTVPLEHAQSINVKVTFDSSHLLPTEIRTNRLLFKPIWQHAVRDIHQLRSKASEHTMRFIPDELPDTLADTQQLLNSSRDKFEDDTSCLYAITRRSDGKLIGGTGFRVDWDDVETYYYMWLREHAWGNSYSHERGIAFISIAFEHLGVETARISALTDNHASCRAIWKYVREFGGYPWGVKPNSHDITSSDERDDTLHFAITREDYYQSLGNPSNLRSGITALEKQLDDVWK